MYNNMMSVRRLVFMALLLAQAPARAATYLQCDQSELKQPDCTTVQVSYTPLHFIASCIECTGGGSNVTCSPGEKANPSTLAVEDAGTNSPVPGVVTRVGTCALGGSLFKFDGTLTQGKTYNIVITVPGLQRMLLLTFTAGSSSSVADGGTVAPTGDAMDAAGSGGDLAGEVGGDNGGCSCDLDRHRSASCPWLVLVLLLWWRCARDVATSSCAACSGPVDRTARRGGGSAA